jgi:Zn-dependent protease with chaperone function
MTATRIRIATLAAATFAWIVAALILWRTKVPDDLRLPSLDEQAIFGARLIERAVRYERFFYVEWWLATGASLGALIVMVRRGPRVVESLRLGRVNAGIILGIVTFTVLWGVSLPFAVGEAWWRRRYGLSTESYVQTLSTAWGTLLAQSLLALVILAILLLLAKKIGRDWWIAASALLVALFAALQLLVPYLLTIGTHPLRNRELVTAIKKLERREHAGTPTVRVEKVSDTTRQANAYSVGYGPSERVVFWDTLLDGRFSDREVRFVAGHELAHLARDHIPKSIAWFALFVVPILGVTAFVTERRGGLRNPGTVPLALLVITVAQLLVLPLQNAVTRRYEAEADWVALTATRDPQAARGLFRGFARTSLSDPNPPSWAYILFYDHPSELARIEQAEAFRRLRR